MITIYASPNATVIIDAVVPLIAPPITDPTPGISFNNPETTALPAIVAPASPISEVTIVLSSLSSISRIF